MGALADAAKVKFDIVNLLERIEEIRALNNLRGLEDELENLKSLYHSILEVAALHGETEEGNLRLVDKIKRTRRIDVEPFAKDHPEMVLKYATVSVTAVEKDLLAQLKEQGMRAQDAKNETEMLLAPYINIEIKHNYDVIDIMGEEHGTE